MIIEIRWNASVAMNRERERERERVYTPKLGGGSILLIDSKGVRSTNAPRSAHVVEATNAYIILSLYLVPCNFRPPTPLYRLNVEERRIIASHNDDVDFSDFRESFCVRLAIDRLKRRRIRAGRVLRVGTFNKQSTLMCLLGVKVMGERSFRIRTKMERVKVRN